MHHLALIPIVKLIGYPGLFAAVFLESGVFFGFFLPGASLLFTAGILASQAFFNVWVLIPLLTFAAILGDNAGYWFGSTVGVRLFLRPNSRFFKHEHLQRAKDFYDKHGAIAIMLARFIPIVRTFAPFVAGIGKMTYLKFLLFSIVGAILWVGLLVPAGYFFGGLPWVKDHFEAVIVAIIIISLLPGIIGFVRIRLAACRPAAAPGEPPARP